MPADAHRAHAARVPTGLCSVAARSTKLAASADCRIAASPGGLLQVENGAQSVVDERQLLRADVAVQRRGLEARCRELEQVHGDD